MLPKRDTLGSVLMRTLRMCIKYEFFLSNSMLHIAKKRPIFNVVTTNTAKNYIHDNETITVI